MTICYILFGSMHKFTPEGLIMVKSLISFKGLFITVFAVSSLGVIMVS